MSAETRPSILLVDDVEANLLALEAVLETLDCEPVRAKNGEEALGRLAERSFAALLLDVQMPGMDGYELARRVRATSGGRSIPILFLTAMHPSELTALRGYASGAVDVLFKPLHPDILRGKVQVFLELHAVRMRLEEAVAAHRRTLADLEAFNYSVSHDLRAPLRPIAGFADLVLEDYGERLGPEGCRHLERIREAAVRMRALIDDLLRLSQVGRARIVRSPIDLAAMATSIVAELRATDPERRVELVARENRVVADPSLTRILLENLLRNAWKFTREREHARIEVGRRSSARETILFVRDDGVGFEPEYAGRMFEPFQRLHDRSEYEGSGIGLAIVERVVRHHGGRVWAESRPNEGATIFFTLERPRA